MKRYFQIKEVSFFLWLFWETQRQRCVIKGELPKNRVQEMQLNSLSLPKNVEHKKKDFWCLLFPLKIKYSSPFKYYPFKLQYKSCHQCHCSHFQCMFISEMKGDNFSASSDLLGPKLPMKAFPSAFLHFSISGLPARGEGRGLTKTSISQQIIYSRFHFLFTHDVFALYLKRSSLDQGLSYTTQ